MPFVDANIVLRYMLWDHEGMAQKAQQILEHEEVKLPFEVIAEVVYVLEGVYRAERSDIREGILGLLTYPNIHTTDEEVLKQALALFSEKKLDFVDTLLIGYHTIRHAKVFSFDKKVNKLLNSPVE